MNAEDVANFLRENPAFFDSHADLLSQISIPRPHGGQAIPIAEWQLQTLREKNRALEAKLAELIQFGEENDAIGEKMHRLGVVLLKARSFEGLLAALYNNLRDEFAVPHSALRLWSGDTPGRAEPEFAAVSEQVKAYAARLTQPFCGPSASAESSAWFGEVAEHIRSVALMPLSGGTCFGMLALGSEDARRFYPEMGTLHLRRLGELLSAALARDL
ncbi:MAG: DUF484 family protein [Betaproteobacteria bacterium]|nr:DUF484 family protein [Betaproteobacteria bacterium]MBI2960246.1 DUF484 family protein [Betaproteobacteria bacterium]